jgi:lipid II:glycine glycyltransferase (peptidoglycan interpeptide bridge formation enzyme)
MQSLITYRWNSYLAKIPDDKKDIYYTEEYVKLYEDKNKYALCYVCLEGDFILLMPFIKENIDGYFFDFETPYGYGGPITNCVDTVWIQAALSEMKDFFIQEHCVAGLIRFHPLFANANFFKDTAPILFERQTVFVDLSVSLDDIWAVQISSKNRNTIRKAEKTGLVFIADFKFEYIEAFVQLYNATMNKVLAEPFYYFTKEYFSEFAKNMQNNSFLGIVKKDNHILAAAIFIFNLNYGHYHLSGSDRQFSRYSPNNFLLWNAIRMLQTRGIKKFHLGGGTDAQADNSLFIFKKSFSDNRTDYYIGKMIYNEVAYKELCCDWEQKNPGKIELYENRLLKYRY